MFINKITIQNFKSFKYEVVNFFTPKDGNGLNIFVGENNSGKSTLFEAVDFLRNGPKITLEDLKNKGSENKEMFVEIEFVGNIKDLVEKFSIKKLDEYIDGSDNECRIISRRSDKIYNIKQGKKDVEINSKKIGLWNFTTKQFENPSGIDADFKKLFEIDFIWSDTNPGDIVKFGATTICGKLIGEIVKNFETTNEYKDFSVAHQKAFNSKESSLKKDLDNVEKRTKEIFKEQFGNAEIKFYFDLIDISSFFKNTKIKINDGLETYLEEKGSGMQRSFALALLQVYAENIIKHPNNSNTCKPFYLFIDEPEICLHPQAQRKLLSALQILTKKQQIFISTHSSYFINPDFIGNIFRFEKKEKDGSKVYLCKDAALINKLKEKENRVFFFHHKDMFFAKKIFFFEGVSDYERFSLYCEKNCNKDIIQSFYFLTGKDDWSHFQKLCGELEIEAHFIFDLDVISKNSQTFYDEVINNKIKQLDKNLKTYKEKRIDDDGQEKEIEKVVKSKEDRCEPLFDKNLSKEELKGKNEIIEMLKLNNINVLRFGMLENYLDKNGDLVLDDKIEKEEELKSIFI